MLEELPGLSVGGENIKNFRYADDTALVADSEEKLQNIVNKVKEKSENLGLYMNVSKTKTMLVNKAGEERNIAIDVDGQELEQVRDFKYLGQIITDDGRRDKEVKRRIAIARSNFINMKDVLATRKLKWDTRIRLASEMLYIIYIIICFRDLGIKCKGDTRLLFLMRRMTIFSYQ